MDKWRQRRPMTVVVSGGSRGVKKMKKGSEGGKWLPLSFCGSHFPPKPFLFFFLLGKHFSSIRLSLSLPSTRIWKITFVSYFPDYQINKLIQSVKWLLDYQTDAKNNFVLVSIKKIIFMVSNMGRQMAIKLKKIN